jgi:DNA-binding GntR family transcriptional regulator
MLPTNINMRSRLTSDSLCNRALNDLREMIVRGEIKPGFAIRETSLSQALNVSRTPVREALKILETEGLVRIRKNQGARVSDVNLTEAYELFEAAAGIERYATELATVRHSAADFKKLEALQTALERAFLDGDLKRYFEVNQNIHLSIVRMAGNATLQSLHGGIFAHIRRLRYFALNAECRWHDSVDEHRAILDALRRGEPRETGALMENHVLGTGRAIAQVSKQRNPRTASAVPYARPASTRGRKVLPQGID